MAETHRISDGAGIRRLCQKSKRYVYSAIPLSRQCHRQCRKVGSDQFRKVALRCCTRNTGSYSRKEAKAISEMIFGGAPPQECSSIFHPDLHHSIIATSLICSSAAFLPFSVFRFFNSCIARAISGSSRSAADPFTR